MLKDISSHSSFEDIQVWIDDCTKQTAKSVLLFLIGNKNDLNDKREVSYEEGEAYAKAHKMLFLEASAKTGHNINAIFERSVKQIAKNISNNVYDLDNDSCGIRIGINKDTFVLGDNEKVDNVILGQGEVQHKKGGCCGGGKNIYFLFKD